MRNFILAALLAVFLLIILSPGGKKNSPSSSPRLAITDKVEIRVEIADSDTERQQGYSNHPPIGYDEGMLFVFERPAKYPFWMKEMLFDLDFIYIGNGRVVHIEKNVPAPKDNDEQVAVVHSPVIFDMLLEVKSGFADKYDLKVGDNIELAGY